MLARRATHLAFTLRPRPHRAAVRRGLQGLPAIQRGSDSGDRGLPWQAKGRRQAAGRGCFLRFQSRALRSRADASRHASRGGRLTGSLRRRAHAPAGQTPETRRARDQRSLADAKNQPGDARASLSLATRSPPSGRAPSRHARAAGDSPGVCDEELRRRRPATATRRRKEKRGLEPATAAGRVPPPTGASSRPRVQVGDSEAATSPADRAWRPCCTAATLRPWRRRRRCGGAGQARLAAMAGLYRRGQLGGCLGRCGALLGLYLGDLVLGMAGAVVQRKADPWFRCCKTRIM